MGREEGEGEGNGGTKVSLKTERSQDQALSETVADLRLVGRYAGRSRPNDYQELKVQRRCSQPENVSRRGQGRPKVGTKDDRNRFKIPCRQGLLLYLRNVKRDFRYLGSLAWEPFCQLSRWACSNNYLRKRRSLCCLRCVRVLH